MNCYFYMNKVVLNAGSMDTSPSITMLGLRGNFQGTRRQRYQLPLASMLCIVAVCYIISIIITYVH